MSKKKKTRIVIFIFLMWESSKEFIKESINLNIQV